MISKSIQTLLRGTILTLSILMLAGCGRKEAAELAKESGGGVHRIAVEPVVVSRQNLTVEKTYSGSLEGEEQANIVAKISERVMDIKVKVGATVKKGQVMIVLDKTGPSSSYLQAEASYRNSEKNLERMKALLAEGAISQQAFDQTQTAYDVAKANYDGARSIVELTAPISGVVTALNVSIGDLAAPGASLAVVADIGKLKVVFNMNENDVTYLSMGLPATVYSDSRPDLQGAAKVSEFYHSADPQSRSFEVKALFENTNDHWFKPGMFVKVKCSPSPKSAVLVVPNASIISDGAAQRVFAIRSGRAYLQTIAAGLTDGKLTEVLSGLGEKDSVALTGATLLRDSSLVTLTQASK
jgi:membrane fusion protein, multidrug efflux system